MDAHIRIWKRGGYWSIEMFVGEAMVGAYVGEPDARDAFDRAASWLKAEEQRQLQASLAGNGEMR